MALYLTFEPSALPVTGASVTGQMLRMEEIITPRDKDHDSAEEHFMLADGSGKEWLAYKYEDTRRQTRAAR